MLSIDLNFLELYDSACESLKKYNIVIYLSVIPVILAIIEIRRLLGLVLENKAPGELGFIYFCYMWAVCGMNDGTLRTAIGHTTHGAHGTALLLLPVHCNCTDYRLQTSQVKINLGSETGRYLFELSMGAKRKKEKEGSQKRTLTSTISLVTSDRLQC
jgi:hypothetical protein